MLEAALAARAAAGTEPRIAASVSRIEIDRDGPSYMIETLRELHRTLEGDESGGEHAAEVRKRPRLRLLIGSDQALDFDRWRDWKAILELAPPAVMPRPPETRTTLAVAYREYFPSNLAGRWSTWTLDLPAEHVSSTVIRRHLARNESTEDLLPPGVLECIRTRGLYQADETAAGPKFDRGEDRSSAYDADV
jgi:nicotinate-nucleotide adenylyltransferase